VWIRWTPMLPVAPPSPDYIPGPKEPQAPPAPQEEDEHEPMFRQPHDPDFMLEPIYPEYILLEDEHILPAEEQPLPPVVSPTAESSWYVAESNLEEDPEEYEDDETEDGLVDYPINRGDDGDDDDGNSSRDDADDEDEDEEEEEEEHLALTNSVVVIPTNELVSPHEGTKPVGYGIRDTWIDLAEIVPEIAPMTIGEVNTRVTELAELHEHDTHDLYAQLEDAQDSRTRISQQVAVDSQWVNLLMEDRIAHQETIQIVEDEAYAVQEAWAHSIGLSQAMQQTEIAELQEIDCRLQAQMAETLRVMGDIRREIGDMQAELLAPREQPRRAEQPGGDARVPNHQDAPRDADSYI
nr:hypothetical protein [Tanacetum cinerariifolium]